MRYAKGDVTPADMSDFEQFRENSERDPAPIKFELTMISKHFEVIKRKELIPDFNVQEKVRAFEQAAEDYLANREKQFKKNDGSTSLGFVRSKQMELIYLATVSIA